MEALTVLMGKIDDIVWCYVLVALCLGAGFYFSLRMKFPQVRLFKDMVKLLVSGEKSDNGITPLFGVPTVVVGAIFAIVLGLVICGGIKRIGKVAEYMAPVMCVVYVVLAVGVIIMNISQVPAAFATIFTSAFGVNQVFGGIVGSAIAWGVKRGVYSNEAGQGSGAIVSASAECSHPAKQGLVQAFSVYIDTLLVCTASGLIVLLTGTFNVVGADGKTMIVENAPGILYGIRWAQTALVKTYGGWCGKFLSFVIIMFVFTSLMGYYYQAEVNTKYLFKGNKYAVYAIRAIFLISAFSGCILNGEIIWTMGDIGCGSMAWLNIIAILLLSNKGIALLKDYEAQKKEGKDPVFDPARFGIEDETGVWDKFKNR